MNTRRSSVRTAVPALLMGAALLVGCSSNADTVDHQAAAQDSTETTAPVTQEELAAIASGMDLCFGSKLTAPLSVSIDTGANARAFDLAPGQAASESTCARFDTFDADRPPVGSYISRGTMSSASGRWKWQAASTFILGRATTEVDIQGQSCPDRDYLYITSGSKRVTAKVCGVTFTMGDTKDIGYLLTASS